MVDEAQAFELGRRIVIWGATGSGKTTLAGELGGRLGLGVVDLDAIRHAQGWDSTPWEEFRVKLAERLDDYPEGWVIAGSYSAISDVYLSRVDTLIWLRLPWHVSFWRLLKRTVSQAWSGAEIYAGSPARETWRLLFLSRGSILWWSVSHHRTGIRQFEQRIGELSPAVRVYELGSAREVAALVDAAGRGSLAIE